MSLFGLLTNLLLAGSGLGEAAFDETLGEEARRSVEIASPRDAITLARYAHDGEARVLAVTSWRDGVVEGVDLGAGGDAVSVMGARGYEGLLAALEGTAARASVPAASLSLPVDFDDRHIAVGTNYPEHASDAGTTRPFLFPKLVQPGADGDDVSTNGGLLDYEVEVAVVTLAPYAGGAAPPLLGLMVANDFTDREVLMHVVDRSDIESGKGFTTGKSFPGYLPVGSLLVVPRDWRGFVGGLALELYVNGRLRQRARASEMVWSVERILAESASAKARRWEHRGHEVPLFAGDAIPPRTLVLTGTPHGTVFAGVPAGVMAAGVLRWLAGGWDRSVPDQVVEAYAEAARERRAYLQPGDEVLARIPGLGGLRSRVVD